MKGGFYPAPPEAVAHAASFLHPPVGPFSILDPCAGEGDAIKQLGELLGCPEEKTFAIELDDSRADKVRALLPTAQVLAPASFFGCRASLNSFSFIWLNPPFDDGYDGQRVEDRFLLTATDWLMPGGVMALICPESAADENSDVPRHGLDLFDKGGRRNFPTICSYDTGYNLFTLRQASRRAWRIGQKQACRIVYFYYQGTMQDRAMALMGKKLTAAEALEGRFSSEGLVTMAGEDANVEI